MPGTVHAGADAKTVAVEARIVRADGTVEELGTVAYFHRNPLKRLVWRLSRGKVALA